MRDQVKNCCWTVGKIGLIRSLHKRYLRGLSVRISLPRRKVPGGSERLGEGGRDAAPFVS